MPRNLNTMNFVLKLRFWCLVTLLFAVLSYSIFMMDSLDYSHLTTFLRSTLNSKEIFSALASRSATQNEQTAKQTGCTFPRLNPWEPSVVRLAKLNQGPLVCRSRLPDLTYVKRGELVVNQTKVQEKFPSYGLTCRYKEITRNKVDLSFKYGQPSRPFNDSMRLPAGAEFILVECKGTATRNSRSVRKSSTSIDAKGEDPEILSRTFFPLIPQKRGLLEVENLRMRKRIAEASPKETLNVVMVGLDTVSRYSFLRAMSKTHDFLMKDLMSFDMTMHSQVGKNTFPNFLPLLTGKSEKDINTWWDMYQITDELDLLWKDFERCGYRTLFSEDWPTVGAFNYLSRGFQNIPTTYYSKPISLAIEMDKEIWNAGRHCIGNQPEVMFHLDYLTRFLDAFPERPLFAFVYLTRIAHENLAMIRTVDDHVHGFFARLNESGRLNKTMLVTFSDHGVRYGPFRHSVLGEVESRVPFTIVTLPGWFLTKYPDVARNLRTNTERLTSHYDTYATLQELLYFGANGDAHLHKSVHGISLFQEIPKNRTCETAGIPFLFCLCGFNNKTSIYANSKISRLLANSVLKSINSKLDRTLCQELRIRRVIDVVQINTFDKEAEQHFRISLQTYPGDAIFETVVHVTKRNESKALHYLTLGQVLNATVGNYIDRLNMYRGQSDCVSDSKMRPFCYCKDLWEP